VYKVFSKLHTKLHGNGAVMNFAVRATGAKANLERPVWGIALVPKSEKLAR
jgi:hypothetical protein